jgi:3-hydroxybutyryl-CoA dehydrogenase
VAVKIESVFVVGGGTMGRGIAGLSALSGFATSVYEADPRLRETLRSSIESSWERAAARGKLAPGAVAAARGRLSIAAGLSEAAEADCVIEAVPESLKLKAEVFGELGRVCRPEAILGSNTSSLSISSIAEAAARPERVVGIHFFNPVGAMPLVEIVRGRKTSEETVASAAGFAETLGKAAILVTDMPGFATSRLGVALGLEAMRMVEEGVAGVADIDRAMELGYGHRMGPLKTSDLVGLDVRLSIAEALCRDLSGERFAPPELLKRLVAEGKTGKKSGEGFYLWEGETAVSAAVRTPERRR